jgi:hypothetical protein
MHYATNIPNTSLIHWCLSATSTHSRPQRHPWPPTIILKSTQVPVPCHYIQDKAKDHVNSNCVAMYTRKRPRRHLWPSTAILKVTQVSEACHYIHNKTKDQINSTFVFIRRYLCCFCNQNDHNSECQICSFAHPTKGQRQFELAVLPLVFYLGLHQRPTTTPKATPIPVACHYIHYKMKDHANYNFILFVDMSSCFCNKNDCNSESQTCFFSSR